MYINLAQTPSPTPTIKHIYNRLERAPSLERDTEGRCKEKDDFMFDSHCRMSGETRGHAPVHIELFRVLQCYERSDWCWGFLCFYNKPLCHNYSEGSPCNPPEICLQLKYAAMPSTSPLSSLTVLRGRPN